MKKTLSIILVLIMLLTTIAILPSAVSAKTKTAKTFYPASTSICGNSNGYVTLDQNNLLLVKGTDGYIDKTITKIKAHNPNDKLNDRGTESVTFFMRGKTVVYNDGKTTYSVGLDGKNRKKLTGNKTTNLLGGYGKDVIVTEPVSKKVTIYKVDVKGKMTKLTTVANNYSQLAMFGNKIHLTPNKGKTTVYNLNTDKTSKVRRFTFTCGSKNMYYLNGKNLVRVDLTGNKKTIAKNVYKILDANNGATVMYSKLDKSKKVVYYKKSGDKAEKQISTFDKLTKKAVTVFNQNEEKYCQQKATVSAVKSKDINATIVGNKVAFTVNILPYDHTPMILSMSINGGKIAVQKNEECRSLNDLRSKYYTNFESVGNTMAYRYYDSREDIYCGVKQLTF